MKKFLYVIIFTLLIILFCIMIKYAMSGYYGAMVIVEFTIITLFITFALHIIDGSLSDE